MLKQGASGKHLPALLCGTFLSLMLLLFPGRSRAAETPQVPIESECISFAQEIASEAQLDGLAAVYRQITFAAVAEQALPSFRLKTAEAKALFTDYADSLIEKGESQKKALLEFAYITYLPNNKSPQVIFRATYRNGIQTFLIATLGFHDRLLTIIDLLESTTMEPLSDAVRRVASPKLKEMNRAKWEKLFRQPPTGDADPYAPWNDILTSIAANKYQAVLESYDKLLPEFKDTLAMRSLHLMAVAEQKKDAYRATWDDYQRLLGEQTGAPFVLLAGALRMKNKDDGMKALANLEKQFNGDRIIHILRTDLCVNVGDQEEAFKHAALGLTQVRAFDFRAQIYLWLGVKLQKWKELTLWLREMERDDRRFESVYFLAASPRYAVLSQTEEFNQWLQSPIKKPYNEETLVKLRESAPKPEALAAAAAAASQPASATSPKAAGAPSTAPAAGPASNAASSGEAVKANPSAAKYVLKGIIYSSRPSANINGKAVMEGDKVGKAKLIKINPNHVIIEADGQQEKLLLE